MSQPKRILISGAGIAGPALALLLNRAGHSTTIVERSADVRKTGQQVDVKGAGLEVIRDMGIEQLIKDKTTKEQGSKLVDAQDKVCGAFAVGTGLTQEIEILRGQLAGILYEQTKENTEYIFGDFITGIAHKGSCATVSFAKGPDRDFDVIVAADGLGSKTRNIAFGKSELSIRRLGQYVSFFTIPYEPSDGTWCRIYNAPGGRCIVLRPDQERSTSAYMSVMSKEQTGWEKLDVSAQKAEYRRIFSDAGWESDRVIRGMEKSEDFYLQEVAQTKMPSLTKDRVALLGDAAYCPSPISGEGTTLAFVGAYILAGCINKYPDYREALSKYEQDVRPFVEKGQKLPPGAPGIVNPQTALGITVLRTLVWVASLIASSGIGGLLGRLLSGWSKELELPRY